jgi:alpha-beta hydrolase superfamily lysophospholipase
LVLFSHGARAFRFQSSTLAHHLASWGMVVASADHPARSLPGLLATPEDATDPAADVRAMRELVVADPTLGPVTDPERVAVSGHSAGGGTTLEVAGDEGIVGYVSYASGVFDDAELPDVPSLFMAGALDGIVEPSRTRAAFEAAPAPSFLLEFADAGHLVFSDLCAIGGDANLIDLAEAAGLGAFLDDGLIRLATDGCEPPNRPVRDVWPGIHQSTTAFYRLVFGIDAGAEGIDAPAVTGVTFEQKTN